MLLLSACGEPDLRDSETLSHILAEAVDVDVFQTRGEENVFYVPNQSAPYTGWAKEMYSDGTQVHRLGQFENGQRTGRWVGWHANGQMRYEGYYKNGQRTGRWVGWHANGQMRYEGYYKDGQPTGRWVGWHANGQKASEGQYENGKGTVRWVEWHEDGQKASEDHYTNCSASFRFHFYYYYNGYRNVNCRDFYERLSACERTGVSRVEWHANGQKASEGQYENGEKTGRWVEWDESGQISSKKHY